MPKKVSIVQPKKIATDIINEYAAMCPYTDSEEKIRKQAELITKRLEKEYGEGNVILTIENESYLPPFQVSWKINYGS